MRNFVYPTLKIRQFFWVVSTWYPPYYVRVILWTVLVLCYCKNPKAGIVILQEFEELAVYVWHMAQHFFFFFASWWVFFTWLPIYELSIFNDPIQHITGNKENKRKQERSSVKENKVWPIVTKKYPKLHMMVNLDSNQFPM